MYNLGKLVGADDDLHQLLDGLKSKGLRFADSDSADLLLKSSLISIVCAAQGLRPAQYRGNSLEDGLLCLSGRELRFRTFGQRQAISFALALEISLMSTKMNVPVEISAQLFDTHGDRLLPVGQIMAGYLFDRLEQQQVTGT